MMALSPVGTVVVVVIGDGSTVVVWRVAVVKGLGGGGMAWPVDEPHPATTIATTTKVVTKRPHIVLLPPE
jgi:hypothetical protein